MIQNSFLHWIFSLFIGFIITLILFLGMHAMINNSGNRLAKAEIYKVIDFIQPIKQQSTPEIKKELPPEPEPPEQPPKMLQEAQESESSSDIPTPAPVNIAMPSLEGSLQRGGARAPKIMGPIKVAKMDSILTPMVQMQPRYPSRAKRMGIEGHVKVRLKVDATGHVKGIKIIESVPEGVFDKSVKKSLKKWKFRPKSVDGVAVAQEGEITLNFKLGGH